MMEQEIKTEEEVVSANETSEQEESEPNEDELTVADFLKERDRRIKAEKKLVELKKSKKESESKESEDLIEAKLVERDFYRDNPEFKDYKEEITSYVKKGLSFDDAAQLVKAKDPAFGNKAKAKSMSVSGGESGATKSVYSTDELSKMSQSEYNQVKALELAGKVRFTR